MKKKKNSAFPGNHLKDLHRQSNKILNLNIMGCILIM